MALIQLPARHIRADFRPDFPVRLRRDDPLWRGLSFAWIAGHPVNLVDGKRPTVDGTKKQARDGGWVSHFDAVADGAIRWNKEYLTTSNGDGTGDFTIVAFANPSAENRLGVIAGQKWDPAGGVFNQTFLAANSNGSFGVNSGSIAFLSYESGATGLSAGGYVDGAWHVFTAVRQSTAHYLDVDGTNVANTIGTVRDISTGSRYTLVGDGGKNSSEDAYNGEQAVVLMWNRALSTSERAEINRVIRYELYRLVEPLTQSIWVPTAAGGFAQLPGGYAWGAMTWGGASPTRIASFLDAGAGSYTATGGSALFDTKATASGGTYSTTGGDASMNPSLSAGSGAYTIAGGAATFAPAISAGAGSYSVTGAPALFNIALLGGAGTYALTGGDATFNYANSYTLVGDAGSYTLTGGNALFMLSMVAGAGSLSATGGAAAFDAGLSGGAGGYVATGGTVTFGVTLTAAAGAYLLTGGEAVFQYGNSFTMLGDAGAFAISGGTATFVITTVASGGAYALTGGAAAFNAGWTAGAGAYNYAGGDATFSISSGNQTLVAGAGSYAITGGNAAFVVGLAAGAGSCTWNDGGASFHLGWVDSGAAYVLTGGAAQFINSGDQTIPNLLRASSVHIRVAEQRHVIRLPNTQKTIRVH